MSEWRTMDTAPKDGSWFMAWNGTIILPICWVDDDSEYEPGPYRGWAGASERWGGVLYEGYYELATPPILWQPNLPPPVQATEAGTAETGTGSVHEGAVGNADAPEPCQEQDG